MESAQTGKLGPPLVNDCIRYSWSWILHVRISKQDTFSVLREEHALGKMILDLSKIRFHSSQPRRHALIASNGSSITKGDFICLPLCFALLFCFVNDFISTA